VCAACVAQGAAYLVPVYAAMKTRTWHRRRHGETVADTASEPIRPVADDPRDEMAEV
jgi:hypothetical protein